MASAIHHLLAATLLAAALPAQNQAVQFTHGTTDQHIDVPVSTWTIPTRGITLEAWITYDETTVPTGTNRWPTILRHTMTANGESYIFRVQAGTTSARVLALGIRSASTFLHVNYNFGVGAFLNWTHVAATFDGTTGTIYVNGQNVATAPITGPIRDGGGNLRIGNGDVSVAGRETWNGNIDEVRIWPFARTQAEIQETMNRGLLLIPHGVSFNLDGHFLDSSQSLMGTAVGTFPFVAGPALTSSALGAFAFGTRTSNCAADRMLAGVGSSTAAGNTSFALVCVDGPAGASGGVLLAAASLPAAFPILGFGLLVDPGNLLPIVPSVTAGSNGVARLPLSLTPTTMVGLTIHAQYVFITPCGAQGLASSTGLTFIVQ